MEGAANVHKPEPWCCKRDVARHYGYSVRWVESMLARGLPSVMIGGQRRFQLSETDRFLVDELGG